LTRATQQIYNAWRCYTLRREITLRVNRTRQRKDKELTHRLEQMRLERENNNRFDEHLGHGKNSMKLKYRRSVYAVKNVRLVSQGIY